MSADGAIAGLLRRFPLLADLLDGNDFFTGVDEVLDDRVELLRFSRSNDARASHGFGGFLPGVWWVVCVVQGKGHKMCRPP